MVVCLPSPDTVESLPVAMSMSGSNCLMRDDFSNAALADEDAGFAGEMFSEFTDAGIFFRTGEQGGIADVIEFAEQRFSIAALFVAQQVGFIDNNQRFAVRQFSSNGVFVNQEGV